MTVLIPKVRARKRILQSWAALPVTLTLCTLAHPALGIEACVRCDSPFAIYRCQVDHPGIPANASIALTCITELAKRNGHATCAVSRETGSACNGEVVAIDPSLDGPVPQAPPPNLVAVTPDPESDQPEPTPAPGELPHNEGTEHPEQTSPGDNTAPDTVEKLAKQTAKASEKTLKQAGGAVADVAKKTGQTIEKTGDAIGNAAKKTWRCISSLFGNC